MNSALRALVMLCLVATLAACGGGGGGGGGGSNGGGGGNNVTGISITPSSLTFTANHDDPNPPPAQTITITALGSGTTYIRGDNGVATGLMCTGTSSCTFDVRPAETPSSFLTPGTTTNGLTFIGCADQTCTTGPVPNGRQTVTYTYTITPGTDFSPNTPLIVNGIENVAPPAQTLTLTHPSGTVPAWHATFVPTGAGPNFVTLSPSSTAAPGTATLQAQFSAMPAGTYTGTIEVQPGTSPRRVRRDVVYNVQSALSATGNTPFVIDTSTTSGGLQQTLTLTAAPGAGVLHWTATENAPWLELSSTTGDTLAGNQVVVSLPPAQLERLPKGIYNAPITFAPSTPAAFASVTVTISVDMRLPGTESVMPRAVGEGTTGEVFIRGSGFATLPGTVKFGGTDAAPPVTRDSDTLFRANHPATLSSGNYKVDLSIPANALLLNREHAYLTVLAPTALQSATADIVLPAGNKYAAVFDDARLALYVANVVDATPAATSTIQRLVWDNGSNSWLLTELQVASLRDITLAPGGDELLALTADNITRIDLDGWSVIDSVKVPSPGGVANRSFAVGNDGRLLISQANNGGVSSNITYFDLHAAAFVDEFVPGVSGNIRASGDGAVIYLVGDGPMRRYEVKTRTYTDGGPTSFGGKALSVARTDARFIVDGSAVYRSDFTKLGSLSASGDVLKAAAITPDGTRAYAYGDSGKLYGFLLDSFTGTDFAPAPGTPITLPHTVASPVMTMSADGRAVFIAGDDRVIVRPVAP